MAPLYHEDDAHGHTHHPGAHLVTGSALTDSSLTEQKGHKGEGHRASSSRRKKLEGMLRRERAKECYQLGLQLNAESPRMTNDLGEDERRKLKKKAIKVSKFDADKRDLLQVMESAEKREQRNSRPSSRGMQTARSALSGYQSVMGRYNSTIKKRQEQPEPLVWMHPSEGAMHSREVFREREREVGLRNDAPLHSDIAGKPDGVAQDGYASNAGCSQQQATAMVRERLRSMLLQDKQAIRSMFQSYDKDNDGVLNSKEFHKAMHALGIPLSEHESSKFMQRFLDHGETQIDFGDFFTKILGLPHDFMQMELKGKAADRIGMKAEQPTDKQRMSVSEGEKWFLAQIRLQVLNVPHCLGRVFAVMDPDHSGTIDTEELREGLRKIGLWLKEDELRQLFQVYDEDQSGEIDYKEFIGEILGIPSMKNIKREAQAAAAAGSRPSTGRSSKSEAPVRGTIRARELQHIIRQKLERAIADPGHLRDIFGMMDRDGSGVLTFDDFALACDSFGIMMPADQKAKLFERFDTGKQGFLSYADFVNRIALVPHDIVDIPHPHAPEARCSTPQVLDEVRDRLKEGVLAQRGRIEKLFKWFDTTHTKKISYGAFRDKLRALKLPIQDHHVKALWQQFGAGAKGHLDFKDFVEQMLEFNMMGQPLATSPLHGTPEGIPFPSNKDRPKPVFDLGQTKPRTGDPKTRRAVRPPSPLIKPFGGRSASAASHRAGDYNRPGTAPSRPRTGAAKVHNIGMPGLPKATAQVDIFAQADDELRKIHTKEPRMRTDRSFRGDHSFRGSGSRAPSVGEVRNPNDFRWESSRSIK